MKDNKLYDSEFEYNGKIFKQFPNKEEAKRLDTLDCLYGLDTIYVKDLADEKNLTEKSFIEETANEYNVELISTIVVDGPNGEMYQVEVKGRPGDIARYFSLGEVKSLSDYFNNYSDILAVSECDINESYEKLEESAEIFYGDTEVNLKLTDGTIIHIACDSNGEGYYYEVYDRFGDEIDGGLMEYEDGEVDRDVPVEEVIERIAEFAAIPSMLDKDTIRLSDEEFIKLTTKSDDNSKFDMTQDYNYKLPDGRYFHFHTTEEGFDYTIFDENGKLLDGGILEYWTDDEDITEKDVLNKLAELTDIPELNDNLEKMNDEFWGIVEF